LIRKPTYFTPGQIAITRTFWQGKIWAAGPYFIVQDNTELLAMYIVPGTFFVRPFTRSGGRITPRSRITGDFIVREAVWSDFFMLRLKAPGSDYSVELFFNTDMSFRAWYINMETPFRRFALGFDYDDEELDIILKPDLSSWHWKDEGELTEAVACGIITPDRANYLRAEGERVAKWLQSGQSPFNKWVDWHPDPDWGTPFLPDGWDVI
jgi:hypothetical protein